MKIPGGPCEVPPGVELLLVHRRRFGLITGKAIDFGFHLTVTVAADRGLESLWGQVDTLEAT